MSELSLRRALALTAVHVSACAAHAPSAEPPSTPCPSASESAANAASPVPETSPAPSGNREAPAPGAAPSAAETARAPSPRDAAAFNGWLAQHEHKRDLPLLVAHAFAGVEARNVGFAVSYASGEAALGATATVTLDGLLDDSVRGEEHVLGFARDAVDAPWRLTQATSRVRCWPGRGHAELSAAPCT